MEKLLRLPAVLAVRGRKKSAHYADVAANLFTEPVAIGARAVAWPEYEVAELNAARIAGWSDDAVRELVRQLELARARVVGMADNELRELVQELVHAARRSEP